MLPQRQAHPAGATRVCVDGAHVLTGGADGVVALYPHKRWPSCQQLWARQCHDGPVTCVALHAALGLAVSCGRDGNVVLHENVIAASTSRVVCRVTGEVRCVLFDTERRRVFIAGDSLRCLQMSPGGCSVQTLTMNVPHPLIALSLSPCGNLLAMASASGAVGVIAVNSGRDSQEEVSTAGVEMEAERLRAVNTSLPNLLSPTARRDDTAAYRLSWGRDCDGALLLLVPGVMEARVLRLEGTAVSSSSPQSRTHRLRQVAGVDSFGMTDLLSATCYSLTVNILCVVLVGPTGVVVAKVDARKWTVTRLQGQSFTGVTDAHVDAVSGDIVVGTQDGVVTYLRREAPKAFAPKKTDGEVAESSKTRTDISTNGGGHSVINNDKGGRRKAEEEDEENSHPVAKNKKTNKKKSPQNTDNKHPVDGGTISDSASNSGRSSSSSSSGSSSGSSSDDDDDGSSSASNNKEDLKKVVVDLKRTNPHYKDDDDTDSERPSAWRNEDPKKVLRAAEEACRKQRSVYLDDEAEESSDNANEEEEDEGEGEGEYGGRNGSTRHNHHNDTGSVMGTDADGSLMSSEQPNDFSMQLAKGGGGGGGPIMFDYAFQIGATPVGEEGSCYLAYNSVGYIRSTADGTTVHFHDMSIQAVRILERGTIIMAALSPVGAAFILTQESEMDSVDDTPCLTLYYRTFIAIGAQSDWRVRLYPGETVRCLTAGIRFTAVATSRYLRLFSLSGLEIAVLSLFPRIVAMVGTNSSKIMHSFKPDFDPLAICYLESGGEMRLQVLDVGSRSVVVSSVTVPLTAQTDGSLHQLQWMGWSEDGPLHVADTAGVLRMLTSNWGGGWIPVLDPRCMTDQTYNLWIWGVSDDAVFAYRSCKSDPPYPAAVASGLPTEHVRLFLPLTRSGTERDMVTWDYLLRREVRADELKRRNSFYTAAIAKYDAVHDNKMVELFQAALKEQQTTRALDLATYLELRDNIEVCAREANAQGHGQLVKKLLALLEMRVKTKKRRRCTLPLEGSLVSERERDLLLRKLLVKEKNLDASSSASATTTTGVGNASVSKEIHTSEAGSTPTAKKKVQTASAATSDGRSSAGNVASSPPKRHVTFTEPEAPTPTRSSTENKRVVSATTIPPQHQQPQQQQQQSEPPARTKPQNPFNRSATTTMVKLANSTVQPPAAACRSATSSYSLVLGDSPTSSMQIVDDMPEKQQPSSPPQQKQKSMFLTTSVSKPASVMKSTSPEPSSVTRANNHGVTTTTTTISTNDRNRSNGTHDNNNDNTSTMKSPKRVPSPVPDTTKEKSSAAANAFRPKSFPTAPMMTTFSDVRADAPVDPFLDKKESDSPVTLEALLVDVGHESSQFDAPRSALFGEALRKRYREEEEEGGDDDVVSVAVPRMAY